MWIISQIWLSWNPPLQSFFGAIFCGVHFGKQWNRKPLPNLLTLNLLGTTGSSGSKESSCNAGDLGSVPGFGRAPGEGNGNPLQYSCLENSMDRGGTWWAPVHGAAKSDKTEQPTHKCMSTLYMHGFPGGSEGKASACNAGDPSSIPGSGRAPGEGNGNPLQYPCLENSMDRGAWQATVHRITKS